MRRAVVVGCCGAGKSALSVRLAHRWGVAHVERDALGTLGSPDYRAAVAEVLRTDSWVFDGPPYFVDTEVYAATEVVLWLDYPRALVVGRALRRALRRSLGPRPSGAGRLWWLHHWIAPGSPWFAFSVFSARRREFSQLHERPELAGKVRRFATPQAAEAWLREN